MTNIELIAKAMRNLTDTYFDFYNAEGIDAEDEARREGREAIAALTKVVTGMGPDASVPDDLRKCADALTDMLLDAIE